MHAHPHTHSDTHTPTHTHTHQLAHCTHPHPHTRINININKIIYHLGLLHWFSLYSPPPPQHTHTYACTCTHTHWPAHTHTHTHGKSLTGSKSTPHLGWFSLVYFKKGWFPFLQLLLDFRNFSHLPLAVSLEFGNCTVTVLVLQCYHSNVALVLVLLGIKVHNY